MRLTVPFTNLAYQAAEIKKELLLAVEGVLDSGQYILGPNVLKFENSFASYCHSDYGVGVANGTSSLYLILKAIGVQEGDEVITAANSFIASASSIALTGAKPVFVDAGSDMNIDPNKIEQAITPATKAIMPVHLTGRPARMDKILEIARKHDIFVLEDAAQAVGAKLNGKYVGSWGDAASFSLHPLKNLYAYGDGGIITTQHQHIYEKLLKSRNHGLKNRDECEFFSFNERLDELQAAMVLVQFKYFEKWTEKRRQLAFRYNQSLRNYVHVPEEAPDEHCVYQTYMIQAEKRNELMQYLQVAGIETKVHYPIPLHLQKAADYLKYSANDLPETLRLSSKILSLPMYHSLTFEQQDYVIEQIRKFYD